MIALPLPPAVMLASVLGLYCEVQLSRIRACSFFVTQSGRTGPRDTIRQRLEQRPVKSGPDSHSGLQTGHAFLFYLSKHDHLNRFAPLRPGFGQYNNSVCNSAAVPVVTLRLKEAPAAMCFHYSGSSSDVVAS